MNSTEEHTARLVKRLMKNVGKRLVTNSEVNVRANADSIKEQRRQRFFEKWSRIRAEGVVKFGLKVTTHFSVSLFVIMLVVEWLQDGVADAKRQLVRFVTSLIFGVVLSAISWWTNEGKYKNILIDNRIRARETQ